MKFVRLRLAHFILCAALVPPCGAQNDDMLAPLVLLLAQSDDPQFQFDILQGMSDGLQGRRGVKTPAGWEDAAAKLAKSPDARVRELAQSLSLKFGSADALAALRRQLMDKQAAPAARQHALELLVAAKDPTLAASLQRLLHEPDLRGAALRGLAAFDDARTPGTILEVYGSLSGTEKKDGLNTLASRVAFARPLLAAIAGGSIPARDLSADIVRSLRNLQDAQINQQVEKLWGVARESAGDKLQEMAKYKKLILSGPPGNPARGRAVFSRTCQQCHTLFDAGGKVGPDLTGSNRADLDYILHNVIDPNAEIPNDYRTVNLETKDERVITGIVKAQDNQAVTLVTANETLTISRGDIRTFTQGEVSMMPEGLFQSLSQEEVRDVVAYLAGAGQLPLP